MGAPRALALCANFGGALDFQEGRWKPAETSLREAVALYRDVGSAAGESLSLQRLGVLLTARGALDEALTVLGDGLIVAERAAMRSHCLTRLHASMIRNRLAARDLPGIELSLAEGLEAERRHGSCVTCCALLLPEVVRAQIELGELAAAEDSCARLQRIAGDFDSRLWGAMAAQGRGRVLLARGEYRDARQMLDRARQTYLAIEQPYEAARCARLQARCAQLSKADDAAQLDAAADALMAAVGAPDVEEPADS